MALLGPSWIFLGGFSLPRWAQDDLKTVPRRPQDSPRQPKTAQDRAQDSPRTAPRRPKSARRGPRQPQASTKRTPRGPLETRHNYQCPRTPPRLPSHGSLRPILACFGRIFAPKRGPKMTPKPSQDGPRTAQDSPKTAQDRAQDSLRRPQNGQSRPQEDQENPKRPR